MLLDDAKRKKEGPRMDTYTDVHELRRVARHGRDDAPARRRRQLAAASPATCTSTSATTTPSARRTSKTDQGLAGRRRLEPQPLQGARERARRHQGAAREGEGEVLAAAALRGAHRVRGRRSLAGPPFRFPDLARLRPAHWTKGQRHVVRALWWVKSGGMPAGQSTRIPKDASKESPWHASRRTSWARSRFPTTPTTASRRCAARRTSTSPASRCPRSRTSSRRSAT